MEIDGNFEDKMDQSGGVISLKMGKGKWSGGEL